MHVYAFFVIILCVTTNIKVCKEGIPFEPIGDVLCAVVAKVIACEFEVGHALVFGKCVPKRLHARRRELCFGKNECLQSCGLFDVLDDSFCASASNGNSYKK